MILLGYELGISFYRQDLARNTYHAQVTSRGLYDISAYNWELTNDDTAIVVDTKVSEGWSYAFIQEGNYTLKLTVIDSFVGSVETSHTFQIINLNSNYYIVNMRINVDGNVLDRDSTSPYFIKGSTPSLLINLVNYNYNNKEYDPLDIEDLDIAIKIKKLDEHKLDIPYYELSYVVDYNNVDNPTQVIKVLPYTAGVVQINLNTNDTDVEGELIVQLTIVDNGNIIKTASEELLAKDSI